MADSLEDWGCDRGVEQCLDLKKQAAMGANQGAVEWRHQLQKVHDDKYLIQGVFGIENGEFLGDHDQLTWSEHKPHKLRAGVTCLLQKLIKIGEVSEIYRCQRLPGHIRGNPSTDFASRL